MKVLVFGQTGQVARALQATHAPGVEIICLNRAVADLSNPKTCAQAIHTAKPDVVINAAAYTNVDGAETDEALALIINGDAPGAMAKAAADLDIPFLHVSTDYVFDGSGAKARSADARPAPINAYGRTKLAGETAVRASGACHVILRTSWVFSPFGGNFVKTMLRLSETRSELSVVGDQIGGPTSAGAIARALLSIAAAMHDGAQGGTYHFSGTPAVSWADFARAIFELAEKDVVVTDIPTSQYPTPAQRPLNSKLDCATLATDFGIKQPEWKPALAEMTQRSDL